MKHTPLVLVIALTFVIGRATVPVAAADKETKQMMADIRMLQEQAQLLQNLIGSLNKTINDAIEAAVKTVNTRMDSKLDEQSNNTLKSFANQNVTIGNISRDLGIVREKIDEGNVRIGSLTREVETMQKTVTQLTVAAASRPAADPDFGVPDQPADATTAAAAPPVVVGMSPDTFFKKAYGDYIGGSYSLAVTGFQGFLKSYPTSELADDAQMFMCKSYLSDGNNEKAVEECDVAIRTYPNGDKTPDAAYLKGLALKNLKRTAEANAAFQFVKDKYAGSDAATLASTQLLTKP